MTMAAYIYEAMPDHIPFDNPVEIGMKKIQGGWLKDFVNRISTVSCSDTNQESEDGTHERSVENDLDYELHFVD